MNTGSTIIGIVLIILCALPFILLNRSRKKKEKIMLKNLSELANEHNCQITRRDFLCDSAIGMDEMKHFVFFFRKNKDREVKQYVDLAEMKSCRVMNINRPVGDTAGSQKVTDQLFLSFIPRESKKGEVRFELYNSDVNVQLSGELQSAEEWSGIINTWLKN
jgi:hypothetical protein